MVKSDTAMAPAVSARVRRLVRSALTALLVSAAPASAAVAVKGIDVYSGNGNITWSSVKNAGYEFSFVKATEGVNFLDSKFNANMTNANAAALWTAPYHFAHPESKNGVAFTNYDGGPLSPNSLVQQNRDAYADAVNEAADFLTAIKPYYLKTGATQYMKPVLDLEQSTIPNFSTTALKKTFVSAWVQIFSNAVLSSLGVRPILYISKSSANTYWTSSIASQHDFWIAWYKGTGVTSPPVTSDTPLFKPWSFWQWSDGEDSIATGTPIPGISAAVDRDAFSGTSAQLAAFRLTLAPEPASLMALGGIGFIATRRQVKRQHVKRR